MAYQLFPFQKTAHDAVVKSITEYGDSLLVSSPTGTGKSLMELESMATLAGLGYTVGMITPKREIVSQFSKHIERQGLDLQRTPIETPRMFWNLLARNEIQMPEVLFNDEAHHASAPTWRRVNDYRLPDGRSVKLVGFTATPMRGLDAEDPNWRAVWKRSYEAINIGRAIRHRYLCPFYLVREVHGSLGRVEGETERQQDQASERRVREKIKYIWDVMLRLDPSRPTVYVCPTQKAARVVLEYFNLHRRHTPGCELPPLEECVDETHPNIRKQVFDRLKRNEIGVVAVNILTEGVDIPEISRVVILRESTSGIITVQSYGRGLRPVRDEDGTPRFDLKPDCEIVDFTNNVTRFRRKLEDYCGIKMITGEHVMYPDIDFQPDAYELSVTAGGEENFVNVELEPVVPENMPLTHPRYTAHARIGKSLGGGMWLVRLFVDGKSDVYALAHDKFRRLNQAMEYLDYRVRIGGRDDLALNMLARIAGDWKTITQREVRLSELLGYALLLGVELEARKKSKKPSAELEQKWRLAQRFLRSLRKPSELDYRPATV